MTYQASVIQDFFFGVFFFLPWIALSTLLVCLFVWSNRRLSLQGQNATSRVALHALRVTAVVALVLLAFVAISVEIILI